MKYPIIELKQGREKSVRNRHPWIFSGALNAMPDTEEGNIIEVRTNKKEILGYGFFSKKSQISCRMFHWGQIDKDPETVDYWSGKIQKALTIRRSIFNPAVTNSYRAVHAEGDFIPGLIADYYNGILVVQMLIAGIEKRKNIFIEAFQNTGIKNIYQTSSVSSKAHEDVKPFNGWISGEGDGTVIMLENALQFEVDYVNGQKTGFFLDQRDNRELLAKYSKNKTVLNAFSYTGGFSIYAAAAGAKRVDSLDISGEALQTCDKNITLNGDLKNHATIEKDCFDFLRTMNKDEYDLIVLDPPAFAKNAHAVEKAARGYKDINLQAMKKIRSNSLLFTFSCSQHISKDLFQKIIFGAAADAGRNVRIIHQLHQPPDHPVNIFHPEGEYLKGLVVHVE